MADPFPVTWLIGLAWTLGGPFNIVAMMAIYSVFVILVLVGWFMDLP